MDIKFLDTCKKNMKKSQSNTECTQEQNFVFTNKLGNLKQNYQNS